MKNRITRPTLDDHYFLCAAANTYHNHLLRSLWNYLPNESKISLTKGLSRCVAFFNNMSYLGKNQQKKMFQFSQIRTLKLDVTELAKDDRNTPNCNRNVLINRISPRDRETPHNSPYWKRAFHLYLQHEISNAYNQFLYFFLTWAPKDVNIQLLCVIKVLLISNY